MDGGMRVLTGGSGDATLVLVHGLGATADVWTGWRPVLDRHWPARWIAPDLPGHGGSAPLRTYTFEGLAAAVADELDPGTEVDVIGHSLGGVVALALASGWFGVRVRRCVGLGIKVSWTGEELARAAALADRPSASFDTRAEAIARHLRVSGLAGLMEEGDDRLAAGVRADGEQWRLALDQRAFAVGAPDLAGLLAAARAEVLLARGEHDAMVSDHDLAELGCPTVRLAGLGHNAHVEDPASVLALLSAAD